jgi:hypothetical protein
MKFQLNDGGRAIAGFLGQAGDCVVRSIRGRLSRKGANIRIADMPGDLPIRH